MPGLLASRRPLVVGLLLGLGCCLMLGCGDSSYRVSGKVSFKGHPIAEGRIFFIPDSSKGNKGQTGSAEIKDGQYDTSGTNGRGAIGGPMLIRIEAWDPTKGTASSDKSALASRPALFPPYQTSAELPRSDSTKDIDVPADAVKGFQKQGIGIK